MLVCLALQVERRGAERRGVYPRPHLGGDHGAPIKVRSRRCPASLSDLVPAPALALKQVRISVATDGGGRGTVALNSEKHAPPIRPALAYGDEVLLTEFRHA